MKVKIGPYAKHYSVSRTEDSWVRWRYPGTQPWDFEDEDMDWIDKVVFGLLDKWQDWVLTPINKFLYKHFDRKVKVRIDNYDIWSADHTLALIILPVLEKLKEHQHGYPVTDPKDAPREFRDRKSKDNYQDNKADARWAWMLDEMIWTFKQMSSDGHINLENYYDPYEPGEKVNEGPYWSKTVDGKKVKVPLMSIEERRRTGKFNPDKYKAYNDRIENGLRLFGKYYRALWD